MENSCKQNASKVTFFTSQYGRNNSISYTVTNICGGVDVFPKYGDFTQTSVMVRYEKKSDILEFINRQL